MAEMEKVAILMASCWQIVVVSKTVFGLAALLLWLLTLGGMRSVIGRRGNAKTNIFCDGGSVNTYGLST